MRSKNLNNQIPKYSFTVCWSDVDHAYIATSPEFPGLSAFGGTEEEALREAKIAQKLFIEDMLESGEALPQPQTVQEFSGQTRLRLPKSLHRQAAALAKAEDISLNALITDAVRTRVTAEQIARPMLAEMRRQYAETRLTLASYNGSVLRKPKR